jgi:prophage regulatory protein
MVSIQLKPSLKTSLTTAGTTTASPFQPAPSKKTSSLLRIGKVSDVSGISRAYIYQLCKEGRFPKPVSLVQGGTSVAWVASEIEDWVNERIAERDQVA